MLSEEKRKEFADCYDEQKRLDKELSNSRTRICYDGSCSGYSARECSGCPYYNYDSNAYQDYYDDMFEDELDDYYF